MIGSLIFGAILGGAAMYFYGGQLRHYVEQTTRGAREKAADTLYTVADTAQAATDTARQHIERAAEAARPAESRPSTIVEPGRRVG